jgi:O-antigen ligase
MLFITQHFLSPGKYYSFTVIEAGQLNAEPYNTSGVIDGYGLTASDIFALLIFIYGFRTWIISCASGIKLQFVQYISNPLSKFVLFCWTMYFVLSFYSSAYISFYPIFSLVNLFQYCKIFIFYIVISYLFAQKGQLHLVNFAWLISGVSVLNVGIAITQFIHDVEKSLLAEQYVRLYSSTEQALRISAPSGFYLHSNEFALFCLLWSFLLMYIYRKTKQKLLIIIIAINLLGVLISQSRTAWLLCLLTFGALLLHQKKRIVDYIKKHHRALLYGFVYFVLIIAFTYPRLATLQYTFEGGSASVRLEMLTEGLSALQQNPWFGYGVHTGVHLLYELFPWGYIQNFPFEIHNAYIQVSLESGLMGALFFFLPFFVILRKLFLGVVAFQGPIRYFLMLGSFLLGTILVYYIFQPHGGRLEVPLLGIMVSFSGNLLLYENQKFT